MTLTELQNCETELGCKVSQLRLWNGNYLVQKIPIPAITQGGVCLPETFRKRSVGNLSTIKGLVVSASEPWQPKHKKRRYIGLDTKSGSYQYQYDFVSGPFFAGDISVGDGIIYNSYNVGKVKLIDCDEELVIVRSIDIEAVFPMESVDTVQVGDHAMTTAATV